MSDKKTAHRGPKRKTSSLTKKAKQQLLQGVMDQPDPEAALRELGNTIVCPELTRWVELSNGLDKGFMDEPFHNSLSLPENIARARSYLDLRSKTIAPITALVGLYANTRGINFNDLEGSVQLRQFRAQAEAATAEAKQKNTRGEKLIRDLTEMTLQKAAKYGVRLPADMMSAIEKHCSEQAADVDSSNATSAEEGKKKRRVD